ncbi:STAS domain-containing protein [Streptodolium elevatio]
MCRGIHRRPHDPPDPHHAHAAEQRALPADLTGADATAAGPTDQGPADLGPQPLQLTWTRNGATLVLSLAGYADSDAALELDEAARRLTAHDGPVEIDLAGVGFLDSTGVHFLVNQHRHHTGHHHAFRVTRVRPHPAHVLHICGVHRLLAGTDPAPAPDLAAAE